MKSRVAMICLAFLAQGLWADDAEIRQQVDYFFVAVDKDSDGKITLEEIEQFVRDSGSDRTELLAAFLGADTNDDMIVTKDELAGMLKRDAEGKPPILSHKDMEMLVQEQAERDWKNLISTYDANGDGLLSPDETGDAPEQILPFDKNGDGKLAYDEFVQLYVAETKKSIYGDAEPPVAGGDSTPTTPPATGGGEVNLEAFSLYSKVGRSWTHKTVTNAGGHEMVSYLKYKVLEVGKDFAVVEMTMLGQDRQPMPGVPVQSQRIPFVGATGQAGTGSSSAGGMDAKVSDATVTVAGGTFECTLTEVTVGGQSSKTWVSKKFGGLVVKMESSMSQMELIEFAD